MQYEAIVDAIAVLSLHDCQVVYTIVILGLVIDDIIPSQIRLDFLTLQPVLALLVQNVALGSMGVQVQLGWVADFVFTPAKIAIPAVVVSSARY